MKKILCLLSALALMSGACSHDDSNEPDNGNNVTLPKKIQHTNPQYPEENFTSIIKYNGNKIVSITNEEKRTDYIYDGNVIVKIETYDITYNRNDKQSEQSFEYTNGKLSSSSYVRNFTSEYPFGQYKGRSVYSYISDDTIKKETYSTNPGTETEVKNDYFEVLTYQNGNLVKLVSTDTASVPNSVTTSIYEYDTKKNPFINVLGVSLLIDEDFDANNLTKHTYSRSSVPDSINKTEYEYSENGYATKQTYYKTDGSVGEISEYFY